MKCVIDRKYHADQLKLEPVDLFKFQMEHFIKTQRNDFIEGFLLCQ